MQLRRQSLEWCGEREVWKMDKKGKRTAGLIGGAAGGFLGVMIAHILSPSNNWIVRAIIAAVICAVIVCLLVSLLDNVFRKTKSQPTGKTNK